LAAAAFLVVLATIGIVNGLWSKNLVVNGTVETGDLRVDWNRVSNNDEFGPDDCTDFGGFDCDGLIRKDVGRLECEIDEDDPQILHFRIFNGYPSYEADCEYHFENTGSIPFHVIGFVIDPGDSLTDCSGDIDPDPAVATTLCDQLKIGYFDNIGAQVDPGNEVSGSIIVHVEQGAAQGTCTGTTTLFDPPGSAPPFPVVDPTCTETQTYDFFIKVCVAQWNEQANYEDCIGSAQHEGPGSVGDPDYDNVPADIDNCDDVFNPNQNPQACDGIDNDGDGEIDEPNEDREIV
jgi:hypothetical protein